MVDKGRVIHSDGIVKPSGHLVFLHEELLGRMLIRHVVEVVVE